MGEWSDAAFKETGIMSQEEGQVRSSSEQRTSLIIIEEEQLSGTLGWEVRRSEVSTRISPSWILLRCHGPLQDIDGGLWDKEALGTSSIQNY